ncbi:SDR family oxidoreductase [Bradyrhizobium diversitatis]|uniref:SDR family oxidoreductase n=1 Tax=Bradyrhizobium diversitatis TaxID=2755406 RepID=A0ABS0PB85_9BRAD|nr:SDR family oxidoreductase [Bradyrhizobium diversitatis]MBH5390300.1 SDR family oxidoreductase [Bradyrhizobium diversitatis]
MTEKSIALVTGANKGLGNEVARQLGRRGLHIYLGSRDLARGEKAASELVAEGLNVVPVQLDVTIDESVAALAKELDRRHGQLDVLVNNAGILVSRPAFEITSADMRETYDTNVFGVVRMIHAMLPLLQRSKHPRIVNIASTTASLRLANDATTLFGQTDTIVAYASSKTAVVMLTVQYANAFHRSAAHAHIKINTATPGYVATDLNNHTGNRTVEEGAEIVVELATLPDDGPSGGFFNDAGVVPW